MKSVWSIGGIILTELRSSLGRNSSQCHFAHHKSHVYCSGIESGSPCAHANFTEYFQ